MLWPKGAGKAYAGVVERVVDGETLHTFDRTMQHLQLARLASESGGPAFYDRVADRLFELGMVEDWHRTES